MKVMKVIKAINAINAIKAIKVMKVMAHVYIQPVNFFRFSLNPVPIGNTPHLVIDDNIFSSFIPVERLVSRVESQQVGTG